MQSPASGIKEHRAASDGGRGVCWEICLAILQQDLAQFQLLTTLSGCGGGKEDQPGIGLPTLDRFPQFSAVAIK